MGNNLYTIGQVSKLLKITQRAVRFYQEVGLIYPTVVEGNSKYRYYSQENIDDLKRILYLKEIGLSLDEIKKYFECSNQERAVLLQSEREKHQEISSMLDRILKEQDFEIRDIERLKIFGTNIQKKNIKKIQGVWELEGIFNKIGDAKNNTNLIQKFSPYKFLAFDEEGKSPWFYYADDQKIIFNTFYKPTSEIYQVKDDQLYVQISNPLEHIFFLCEKDECVEESHILKFKRISDDCSEYKQFIHSDEIPQGSVDNQCVGVWSYVGNNEQFTAKDYNEKNDEGVLIITKEGDAKVFTEDKIKKLEARGKILFDRQLLCGCKFKIEEDYLILESKTRVYKFTGKLTNYRVYKKVKF